MVIDCNTHPTVNGKWFNSNLNASVQNLLQQMDHNRIEKSVIVPFNGIISNEFILETFNQYPDRFIPAISINPASYRDTSSLYIDFENQYAQSNVPILKLHNRLHNYDLLDERVYALLTANELRTKPFVVFICGLIISKDTPAILSPPLVFHKIVTTFSKTKFVIMHCGVSWAIQTYEAIKDCSNTYMDLSYVQSKYKGSSIWMDLKFLCQNFDQRIIYGSDFPEIDLTRAMSDFKELTVEIEEEKTANILYNNFLRIIQ